MKGTLTKPLTVLLSDDQHHQVNAEAKRLGKSAAEIVRRALASYVGESTQAPATELLALVNCCPAKAPGYSKAALRQVMAKRARK